MQPTNQRRGAPAYIINQCMDDLVKLNKTKLKPSTKLTQFKFKPVMIPKLSRPILKHHEVHEEEEIDLENEEENKIDDANELTDEEELYFDNNITDNEEYNN